MWEENVINRSWLKSLNKLKVLQVEQLMGWTEIEVLYRHGETSEGGVKKAVLDVLDIKQQQWSHVDWLSFQCGPFYGVMCILYIPSQPRESPRIIFLLDSSAAHYLLPLPMFSTSARLVSHLCEVRVSL